MRPTRRERGDSRWAAFYRSVRCRDCCMRSIREDLHLYAVAQGSGGSFFHWWCILVSAGHLGPAGVDGGRVPITQHTRAPTFVSTSTATSIRETSLLSLLIEDATVGKTTIGRWEDKRSFTYVRVASLTRVRSYYVIFRHRFFIRIQLTHRVRSASQI